MYFWSDIISKASVKSELVSEQQMDPFGHGGPYLLGKGIRVVARCPCLSVQINKHVVTPLEILDAVSHEERWHIRNGASRVARACCSLLATLEQQLKLVGLSELLHQCDGAGVARTAEDMKASDGPKEAEKKFLREPARNAPGGSASHKPDVLGTLETWWS